MGHQIYFGQQGQTGRGDSLSSEGRNKASVVADRLRRLAFYPTLILTSPAPACVDTGTQFRTPDCRLVPVDALHVYGTIDGLKTHGSKPVTRADIRHFMFELLDELLREVRPPEEHIVVIGHELVPFLLATSYVERLGDIADWNNPHLRNPAMSPNEGYLVSEDHFRFIPDPEFAGIRRR